jgi:hypothetical protein
VIVTVPAHAWLWSAIDDISGHKRRYTAPSLRASLQAAGLRVAEIRHFNAVLLPLQSVRSLLFRSRRIEEPEARLRALHDALRVPSAPINRVLRLAMAAEIALARLPISVGTSLIAVAYAP